MLTHPDQSFVTYVLDGLQNGFRVGFNRASVSLKSATQNMPSASLQPSVIDDYLYTELAKGHVAGPFSSPPLPHLHISRFGVIPKKHQPGKWRLILDLSSPDGHSVNDGIRKDPFTVQYMKVDDIIDGIMSLGRGTLLAKFDVESVYRIIPIHPKIVIFSACSGKAITLWTWPYLLVCVQRLTFFLQLRAWLNGFSKNSMT